jgi:hypothetical protein
MRHILVSWSAIMSFARMSSTMTNQRSLVTAIVAIPLLASHILTAGAQQRTSDRPPTF